MKQLILVFLILCLQPSIVKAAQATIAVASNFIHPMKDLVKQFHRTSSHRIQVTYGSSGKIYAQIKNTAPFDIFFSADSDKPQKLVASELGSAHYLACYAVGRLVLWSNHKQPVDPLSLLKSNQFSKLALANKRLAPYGMAAYETLVQLDLVESSRDKWVIGENVAQSFQFVASGNAQLGFIALSQVKQKNKQGQSYWLVPQDYYQPVIQKMLLLKRAENNPAAIAFYEFMQSKTAKQIMADYGYLF